MREKIANLIHRLADTVGGLSSQTENEVSQQGLEAIRRDLDLAMEEIEAEAKRRCADGLMDLECPEQWKSYFYMRQGYRVSVAPGPMQNHWCGGPTVHEGAICPLCNQPLLLLWDINGRDARFHSECPEFFDGIDRLPLYYCARHPEETIYQVRPKESIRTFQPQRRSDEGSPFGNIPPLFERKPLQLEPIPRNIENLLVIIREFDEEWLQETERASISEYLGIGFDRHLSQFGGTPFIARRYPNGLPCPNPECLTHRMGHPMLRNKLHFQMKQLAVIDADAGFEWEHNYAQIAFHLCWKCFTVHAEYLCD